MECLLKEVLSSSLFNENSTSQLVNSRAELLFCKYFNTWSGTQAELERSLNLSLPRQKAKRGENPQNSTSSVSVKHETRSYQPYVQGTHCLTTVVFCLLAELICSTVHPCFLLPILLVTPEPALFHLLDGIFPSQTPCAQPLLLAPTL